MAQIKFYSYASLPESVDSAGVYFIQGGELYKGSQRFGLGRVTDAATEEALNAIEGKSRGDINVGYQGAKVWDGETWQPLGGDIDALRTSWRADISTWTAGLSVGGSASYITSITQDADGKVTANAVAFPSLDTGDSDGEVKLGTDAAKVSGWDALVGRVSDIESIVDASGSSVAATTGSFTNLYVADTATFDATTVNADTLTINGSTVEQLADKQIAAISASTAYSTSTGITVSVTTQGGSVTEVSLDASSFGNVMHFKDVVASTGAVSNPVAGDIVIIGSTPDAGFVSGQEYVFTNAGTWELIGDQNTYAVNAYSSTATVLAGATTLPGAMDAAGAAIDTLVGVVAGIERAMESYTGTLSSSSVDGITVSVSMDTTTMSPSVGLAVDSAALSSALDLGTAASQDFTSTFDASAATLPTCSAVASYVVEALTWITE